VKQRFDRVGQNSIAEDEIRLHRWRPRLHNAQRAAPPWRTLLPRRSLGGGTCPGRERRCKRNHPDPPARR
jgi:hypothetical protein